MAKIIIKASSKYFFSKKKKREKIAYQLAKNNIKLKNF